MKVNVIKIIKLQRKNSQNWSFVVEVTLGETKTLTVLLESSLANKKSLSVQSGLHETGSKPSISNVWHGIGIGTKQIHTKSSQEFDDWDSI